MLQSLNIIKKHIPNVKLLIVGKPTFKDYFRSLKKLDNKGVIFTGFVPDEDLPYYYAACDVYVTASLWEGFDLPATEAQACGKKVVAFDIGSHSEIVKNGTLVKNKDIKSFSEAVVKLIK